MAGRSLYTRKVLRTVEVIEFWECQEKDPKAYAYIEKDGTKSPIEIPAPTKVEVLEPWREATTIEKTLHYNLYEAQKKVEELTRELS
jgi:hypothetical protein